MFEQVYLRGTYRVSALTLQDRGSDILERWEDLDVQFSDGQTMRVSWIGWAGA